MTHSTIIRSNLPALALLVASALWGASFLMTQIGLADADPMGLVGLRFLAAALALALVFPGAVRSLRRADVVAGLIIAVTVVAANAAMAFSLETTPTARVAFISALYVPLVPVLQFALFGTRPPLAIWVGVVLSGVGVAVMSGVAAAGLEFTSGDLLAVASAFVIAFEVVLLGRLVLNAEPVRVALVTVAATAVIATVLAVLTGESMPKATPSLAWIVAAFGAATAYTQFAMSWGQRRVSPERAAMIYSTEPVFGGLIGFAAGEVLGVSNLVGGAVIVAGVIVASLPWSRILATSRDLRRATRVSPDALTSI